MEDEVAGLCRRFLNASYATYTSVPRNIDAQLIGDDQRSVLAGSSAAFRGHLKRLAEDVSSTAERLDQGGASGELLSRLESYYDLLYSIEKSWHVCEIFTINPTKTLSLELVRWIKVRSDPSRLFSIHFTDVASPLHRCCRRFVMRRRHFLL
jgi:hypothetical protein